MKFLFIAPRYHTNQIPITKKLINSGHKVEFFVHRLGSSEDYSVLRPEVMKQSLISQFLLKIIDYKYKANVSENIKTKVFLPAIIALYNKISLFKPNVVIVRDVNLTSISTYIICKVLKVKAIIYYDQAPLYQEEKPNNFKLQLKKIISQLLLPNVRITPVYNRNEFNNIDKEKKLVIKEREYFVPFVVEAGSELINKSYMNLGKLNILSVGKYRDYKNHFLLIDAINLIKNKEELNVTIVGQVTNEDEMLYYNELQNYIKERKLDGIIKLIKNVEHNKMKHYYQDNDVFVLTSKYEIASISILEAMSNGLVTISTDANGTASYIKEGQAGYLFRTLDAEDLAQRINYMLLNKEKISAMGKCAFEHVTQNYSDVIYYKRLKEVLQIEFNLAVDDMKKD